MTINTLRACLIGGIVLLSACSDRDTSTPTPARQGGEQAAAIPEQTTTETGAPSAQPQEGASPVAGTAGEAPSVVETAPETATDTREEMLKLARSSGCLSCHQLDKPLVGPTWNDVAKKYRPEKNARMILIGSIHNGSRGKWGRMSMPAQSPRVTDTNIERLADFILSLAGQDNS
ncbi:MAG: hypothetical protein A2V90_06305 [Gammaproteobacteria bacterium RBG_16_57_12]|nr:MAG: hypothetical protein A2V90_06305 [Gammaproteobacteria bacterium RBG_16_57_12]